MTKIQTVEIVTGKIYFYRLPCSLIDKLVHRLHEVLVSSVHIKLCILSTRLTSFYIFTNNLDHHHHSSRSFYSSSFYLLSSSLLPSYPDSSSTILSGPLNIGQSILYWRYLINNTIYVRQGTVEIKLWQLIKYFTEDEPIRHISTVPLNNPRVRLQEADHLW